MAASEQTREGFRAYCVVELFGHQRTAGLVTEQEIGGHGFVRVDVPHPDGTTSSHLYGPTAIYAIHPVTEEAAHAVAATCQPEPVHRWELPAPAGAAVAQAREVICPRCGNDELLPVYRVAGDQDGWRCATCGWRGEPNRPPEDGDDDEDDGRELQR